MSGTPSSKTSAPDAAQAVAGQETERPVAFCCNKKQDILKEL